MKSAQQPSVEGNAFPVFVVLYCTAFLMEMTERWHYSDWTLAAVALTLAVIALPAKRVTFLVFLVLTTAYFLFFRFPEVANHVNLMVFCNLVLIVGLGYWHVAARDRVTFDDYLQSLLSPLHSSNCQPQ